MSILGCSYLARNWKGTNTLIKFELLFILFHCSFLQHLFSWKPCIRHWWLKRYVWAAQLGPGLWSYLHCWADIYIPYRKTNRRTCTALVLAQWLPSAIICRHLDVPHILTMGTILLFEGGIYFAQIFWLYNFYSRPMIVRRQHLIKVYAFLRTGWRTIFTTADNILHIVYLQ